ncbi:MAG: sulfotransferase domain-containing protein [Hahellaceae bacterium]|nr:sulfotransferase domain-containing protein [Hahellaceae bacterium]MCP5211733.1 sulfotransferase domain-containing protein [Hahellaceae bacterium]
MSDIVLFAGNDIARRYIEEYGSLNIAYIVDNDVTKQGTTIAGIEVKPVHVLLKNKELDRIVICSEGYFSSILYDLLSEGFDFSRIWGYLPSRLFEKYLPATEIVRSTVIACLPFSGARILTPYLLSSYRKSNPVAIYQNITEGIHALVQNIQAEKLLGFVSRGGVTYSHLAPSVGNLRMLASLVYKSIVLVRDPRQVIVSFIRYIDEWNDRDRDVFFKFINLPHGYERMSYGEKIDYQLDCLFPLMVNWLKGWGKILSATEQKERLLLVHYEKMLSHPQCVAREVSHFLGLNYDTQLQLGKKCPRVDNSTEYIMGVSWKKLFNGRQINRVDRLLTDDIRAFYGWD